MLAESIALKPLPDFRAKILAKVYAEILRWPNPKKTKIEPSTEDLGQDAAADSGMDGSVKLNSLDAMTNGGQ